MGEGKKTADRSAVKRKGNWTVKWRKGETVWNSNYRGQISNITGI